MGEKCMSTPRVTIHRHPENSQLGMRFVHNWLGKRPYTLCRSGRGIGDLQLCYSPLGPLQFKNLEKNPFKQGQTNFKHSWPCPRARRRPTQRSRWTRTPRPALARWSMRHGPPLRTAIPALSPVATRHARMGGVAPTMPLGQPRVDVRTARRTPMLRWRTDTANQRGEWMGADKNSSRRR
jgi:hypothetical protein